MTGATASRSGLPIVVLEATDTPAAAFAAALLGDFGAEVIVAEPVSGSGIRQLGGEHVRAVWWSIIGRNKHSLAVDPQHPSVQGVFEAAARQADIVLVDNSPCGQAVQRAASSVNKNAQIMRIFTTGEDRPELWPGATAPAFAGSATGMVALTGYPDGPPIQAEFPLADATTGIMAAALAIIELRRARLDGAPARGIDLALHETLQRMNEWQTVVAGILGRAEPRNGNRFPMNWNVGNIFRTRDGKLLTVSAATPSVAERLMMMVGGEALCKDPRFRTPADRRVHMDALDAAIAEWMSRHDAQDAMRLVRENDVVVGPIYDAGDLVNDPHLRARSNIMHVPDGEGGTIPMPAPLPKIDSLPGSVRSLGTSPGAGTVGVLTKLGFTANQIAQLRADGAVHAPA